MNTHNPLDPHCHLPDYPPHPNLILPHERPFDKAHVDDELEHLSMEDWRLNRLRADLIVKHHKRENYIQALKSLRSTIDTVLSQLNDAQLPDTHSTAASSAHSVHNHWYRGQAERQASSWINNAWNAASNWSNALEANPAGLLATMRVQADNLAGVIQQAGLYGGERDLVQQLVGEVRQALYNLNPASLNQQAQRQSLSRQPMRRTANSRSTISSNAKAALGCMAYLQDPQLFPDCGSLYQYIHERLEQIFRIADGDFGFQDVMKTRQQEQSANAPSSPEAPSPNAAAPAVGTGPYSGSMSHQSPTPVPYQASQQVAPTPAVTDGAPAAVIQWAEANGTSPQIFLQRVENWASANGSGQVSQHLKENGIPGAIINWVTSAVNG